MFDETIFLARPSSIDEPDWGPLEAFLPEDLCGGFMWMNACEADGLGCVQAYKHSWTRRYLHLDADAQPYEYLGAGRLRRMRRTDAIEQSITMPFVLFHATDEEKTLLKQAFTRAAELDQQVEPDAQIAPSSPAAAFRRLPAS